MVDKQGAAPFSGLSARTARGAGLPESIWSSYPLFGGGEITSIAMDPTNSQTVYVGTRVAGVFKTTNGGQSWQPARNDLTFYPIRSLRVSPQDPKTLYAGTDFDGIWKSIDGGDNWFKSSSGLDDGLIVFQLVINPLNPSTLYAGLAGGVGLVVGDIYESKDGGASWEKRNSGIPHYEGSAYTVGIISLAIDPTDPLLLYAGTTYDGAFESADGGGNWIAINNNLPVLSGIYLESVNALAVDTHHSNRLGAIIDGQYYAYLNNQWQLTSKNHFYNGGIDRDFLYFHPTDPLAIYSSGSTFSKSADGGPNWTRYLGWGALTYSGTVGEIVFPPSSPNTIYAATSPASDYFGGVYKSADQGQTWALASQGITATTIRSVAIDPQNSKFMYAGTGEGFFWGTKDGGITWSRGYYVSDQKHYEFGFEVTDIVVDPLNSKTIYIASDEGVYKSVDQGQTFTVMTDRKVDWPDCMAISPGASGAIYLGDLFGNGVVFKSSDGGLTWVQKTQGLPPNHVASLAIDPNQPQTVWAGTSWGGIAKSIDGGDNWAVKGLTQKGEVDAIAVRPDNSKVIFAGIGSLVGNSLYRSIDSGDSWQMKLSNIGTVYRIVFDPRNPDWLYAATEGSGVLQSRDGGATWTDYSAGLFYPMLYSLAISRDTAPILVGGTYGSGLYWTSPPAPSALPTLEPGTLANGATYIAGGLVPGSWAQVKGTNLSTTTRLWAASDFTGLGSSLPTNLSGVQVNVNHQPAALYYISPTQVSFQVAAGVTGTASVEVVANGVASNFVTAAAATNSPGIFPIILGSTNYATAVFLDGKIAADPSNGPAFRKAVPGDTVQLFATGLVPSPAGTVVSTTLLSGVTVTIGTVTIPASGAALVAVGEFQINFTVPQSFASMPPGLYPISISINGVTSPASINSSPPGPLVIPIQH
ncbi:MAG: hypothetical protein LAQ69_12950 [Acidobacteriia bacterium]|nr:hypothetical protein [Terriglobia bacterium]